MPIKSHIVLVCNIGELTDFICLKRGGAKNRGIFTKTSWKLPRATDLEYFLIPKIPYRCFLSIS